MRDQEMTRVVLQETLEGKMRRIKGKVKGTTSSLSSSKENRC
jgi:hypothetical protein